MIRDFGIECILQGQEEAKDGIEAQYFRETELDEKLDDLMEQIKERLL